MGLLYFFDLAGGGGACVLAGEMHRHHLIEELELAFEAGVEHLQLLVAFQQAHLRLIGIEQRLLDATDLGTLADRAATPLAGPQQVFVRLHRHRFRRRMARGDPIEGDVGDRVTTELHDVGRHLEAEGDRLRGVHQIARTIDDVEVVKVRPGVVLGVGLADADIAAVRRAEEVDELTHKRALLIDISGGGITDLVLLVAQQARHPGRLVEGALGIERRPQRALVDLLEVGLASFQLCRRDIKGDRPRAQAERIEVGVGAVDRGLEVVARTGELVELRHGGAVDDLHAAVVRIGVLVGQQGVG